MLKLKRFKTESGGFIFSMNIIAEKLEYSLRFMLSHKDADAGEGVGGAWCQQGQNKELGN